MRSTHTLTTRLAAALLTALYLLLVQPPALPNTAQVKEKKKGFTDEDLKVEKLNGKWAAQTVPDLKQAYDPTVPVFVKFLNTFYGKDKYLGLMKVAEAELENRSPRAARTAQLRWVIVSVDNPETVLLEGLTPFFEARVEPYSVQRLEIPEIYFNKILRPLRKDGDLNGHFRLVVGVHEVRFSDDSVWQRPPEAISLLRVFHQKKSPSSRSRYEVPTLHLGAPSQKCPAGQFLDVTANEATPGLVTFTGSRSRPRFPTFADF